MLQYKRSRFVRQKVTKKDAEVGRGGSSQGAQKVGISGQRQLELTASIAAKPLKEWRE